MLSIKCLSSIFILYGSHVMNYPLNLTDLCVFQLTVSISLWIYLSISQMKGRIFSSILLVLTFQFQMKYIQTILCRNWHFVPHRQEHSGNSEWMGNTALIHRWSTGEQEKRAGKQTKVENLQNKTRNSWCKNPNHVSGMNETTLAVTPPSMKWPADSPTPPAFHSCQVVLAPCFSLCVHVIDSQ